MVPAVTLQLMVLPANGAPFSLFNVAVRARFSPDPIAKVVGWIDKEVEASGVCDIVPVELPELEL
jgi:hypothetical protein